MDQQLFIDRLLETENLTDHLEDDEANSLLNWGVAQINGLVKDIEDHDAASEKVNGLMDVMRGVNFLAGNPSSASHETVADLLSRYDQIVGASVRVEESERRSIAERISKMQPGEAIVFLTEWLPTKKL